MADLRGLELGLAHARAFSKEFFDYYNHEHYHSGLGLHTPASIHHGTAEKIRADRADVLATAYTRNPERFSRHPQPPKLPTVAWINQPSEPAPLQNNGQPRVQKILTDSTAVIMRLLGKEPEQRYQSGEGLAYDLARLRDAYACGVPADFVLSERDFPMRLTPPARLVGRDGALAELRTLFAAAVTGNRGVALVTGAQGVGKTALIEQLRPTVTGAGGRFVAGCR